MTSTALSEPTDGSEIELKLEIDPAAIDAVADSAALAGHAPKIIDHVSVYYDTPEQDLRDAGVSLRIRSSEGRHVQTIKAGGGVAAGLFARQEWEHDVTAPEPELDQDSQIRKLLTDDILSRIMPSFTVAITRRKWLIEQEDGTVELVADTGIVSAGERTTPVSEIEFELKSGLPSAIFTLMRALDPGIKLRLGVVTKGERGYRLLDAAPPGAEKAERIELEPGTTVADAFAQIVAACLRHFRLNETILQRAPGPAALHQARVALRRLRSALSIFQSVVADARFPHLAAELKWLAGTLGEARDLDVLIERLADEPAEPVKAAHDAAYVAALDALDSERARHLMIDLVEWATLGAWRTQPDDPDATTRPAIDFASKLIPRLVRRIDRRGRHLERLEDEPRHRVRIAAKKLRYAVDFFESLYTKKKPRRRIKAFTRSLVKLQDHLGTLNDIATAPALIERFGIAETPNEPVDRDKHLSKAARARERLIDAKRFW